jgi:hypothetical protein
LAVAASVFVLVEAEKSLINRGPKRAGFVFRIAEIDQ